MSRIFTWRQDGVMPEDVANAPSHASTDPGRTRILIIAAGEGRRWGGHNGTPKHLAPVFGTTLLRRLVGQFRPHGEVIVVAPPDDPRYRIWGAGIHVPETTPHDADKFLSSASMWNSGGRTIIVYGDTFLTEYAVHRIISDTPRLSLYGRWGRSYTTGTPWGECFAYSFLPAHQAAFRAALDDVRHWQETNLISRSGGWETFRRLNGANWRQVRRKGFRVGPGAEFVEIDDWSDDFDIPEDYDRWMLRRADRGLPTISPRLSVAIMAHPSRAAWVDALKAALPPNVTISWDDGTGVWGTARRGWLAADPTATTHHLLLQDDVLLPPDFFAAACNAVADAPPDTPLALYTMRYRVLGSRTARYLQAMERGERWFADTASLSGQAIVLPTSMIADMLAFCDRQSRPQDDLRVRDWCRSVGVEVLQSIPSIVQHRTDDNPTLVPGNDSNRATTRDALAFIGFDHSALEAFPHHA